MKYTFIRTAIACTLIALASCKNNVPNFDASGSFEADEIIVSAEATGVLKSFTIEEGQTIPRGSIVGQVDSVQLYLKKLQLEAQLTALLGRKPNIGVQLAALQAQLSNAVQEQTRIDNLVKAEAATTKQLDDINSQIAVLQKQIDAQKSNLQISSNSVSNDAYPVSIQIEQIQDQLKKCTVVNPINGTIITKYANANEMTAVGKPLYKIADLTQIVLRAYITGDQLSSVKLHQQVTVMTDDGKGGFVENPGTISWISEKAEFTPKTIQTKNERANLVYAMKINVKNNGNYKIGMYGQIKFK